MLDPSAGEQGCAFDGLAEAVPGDAGELRGSRIDDSMSSVKIQGHEAGMRFTPGASGGEMLVAG